jgi:cytidine deaminase
MDSHQIGFQYRSFPDRNELSGEDQQLILDAITASEHAYAPYSEFKVGAAIRTTDHITVSGSNQENGAFPIGQCAERVALYSLVHAHGRKAIDTIAVVVDNVHQHTPASPCGSCRQLLVEYRSYQRGPIRLLLTLAGGGLVYEIADVIDLLPLAFDGKFLGQ